MQRYKNIFILGDPHGHYGAAHQVMSTVEDSLLICVGDFGAGFTREAVIDKLDEIFGERKNKFYTIRGNHDNPSYFDSSHDRDNIKFLPDYTYKEINDKKFAFVGGAVSIDRHDRTAGVNWWENEVVKLDDDKYEQSDILISHTAPSFCDPVDSDANLWNAIFRFCFHATPDEKQDMFNDLRDERKKMNEIVKGINPSHLYYGHFHSSASQYIEDMNLNATLLDINEVIKLQ
jgi:predicted phosphodiesterase